MNDMTARPTSRFVDEKVAVDMFIHAHDIDTSLYVVGTITYFNNGWSPWLDVSVTDEDGTDYDVDHYTEDILVYLQ